MAGHIDIGWNTPFAYLQAKERLGGQCLVLGMRDSDVGFTTVFIGRKDALIHSLSDLKGKRFALGSRDSSHAPINNAEELRSRHLVNVVTPEAAIAGIRQRVSEVPVEMYTMMLSPPGIALSTVVENIELFAKRVMPNFR